MKPLLSELFLPCSGMHSPIRANRYPLTTITGAQRASGQTHSRARSHQDVADLCADRSTAYLVSCIRVRSAHGNSLERFARISPFRQRLHQFGAVEQLHQLGDRFLSRSMFAGDVARDDRLRLENRIDENVVAHDPLVPREVNGARDGAAPRKLLSYGIFSMSPHALSGW